MFAVIKVAGFQYRVEAGEVLQVPKIDVPSGESMTVQEVLLVQDGSSVRVGTPFVEGASVSAEVIEHGRSPKLVAGKFKRRKKYRRRWGHRQDFTTLRIADITA